MFKVIISCALLFLMYIGCLVIYELDQPISLVILKQKIDATNYDLINAKYFINSTVISIISLGVLCVAGVIILLKIIAFLFNLPTEISIKYSQRKKEKYLNNLMQSMSYIMLGENSKALELLEKTSKTDNYDLSGLSDLLVAQASSNTLEKLNYFEKLRYNDSYKYIALKNLIKMFMTLGNFDKAKNYAIIVFNMNSRDYDALSTLIDCYVKLDLWPQFNFVVTKLKEYYPDKLTEISDKISNYYLTAANHSLRLGNKDEAVYYLKLSLQYNHGSFNALELYVKIQNEKRYYEENLRLTKQAFNANPKLEFVQIYCSIIRNYANHSISQREIYHIFTKDLDHKHLSLLISIASYLDLPDEVIKIRDLCDKQLSLISYKDN